MKRIVSFVAVFLFAAAGIAFAQDAPDANDVGDLDRDAAIKAFAELSENAQKGLTAPNALVKGDDGTSKFAAIAPVDVPLANGSGAVAGCNNAVKIWFELTDGRYVNPKAYHFAPNEVFYVHVLSAVPVYVTLYQNYPGVSQSKRAYPDGRFPNSFRSLKPGEGTRLPVAFQMDANYADEYMSVVVTRADWEGIRQDAPQSAAVAVAVAQAGNQQASAAAYTGIVKGNADISKETTLTKFAAINEAGLEDKAYEDGAVKCRRVRYYVSYPRYVYPAYYCRYVNRRYTYIHVTNTTNINFINYRACYTNIDDAALYLFSDNGVGQLQITLNKCGRNWHW
ncbi:MAG: hypothetical protein LBJ67_12810 [Planctomycetaceae bacterium]|jgi:hypothetical protein|nr:hypothetical protein [Planctomycetaceae bacterium]